jgi:glycosyltransferase involved in cell wall biosynthesis
MKILMLGSKEYPFGSGSDFMSGGGIEIHVEKLSKYLARDGHEVFIVTRRFRGQKTHERKGNLHVYRVGYLPGRAFRSTSFNALSLLTAVKIISKHRIDLIHCHGIISGFFGAKLSFLTGKPMVLTPHGTIVYRRFPANEALRFFQRVAVKRASRILFISRYAKDQISPKTHKPSALLTNGIDLEDFAPSKKAWKGTRFLFIGRLLEIKGIRHMLTAFRKLHASNPNTRLTIAGDGPLRDYLLNFMSSHPELDIRYLGWRRDTPKLLSENDCFILPSWEKGQPVALLEAMSSGKAIITSLGFITRRTGIHVPPRDPEALCRAMLSYSRNPGKYSSLGRNARKDVTSMSWSAVVKQFEREYLKAIRSRNASSSTSASRTSTSRSR